MLLMLLLPLGNKPKPKLDDVHAMLNNVSAERDAALNDLRRAGGVGEAAGRGGGADDLTSGEAGSEEEVLRLRRDCDKLRDQVGRSVRRLTRCFLE